MEHVPILDVDLTALTRNWQLLKATHKGADCAAVVKANAYGLGVEMVAAALADSGCRHFFVATLEEATLLRPLLTSHFIYVFNGVQPDEETTFLEYNLIPVLNSWEQFERWEKAVDGIEAAPAALHVDTGMNRLGFTLDDAEKLATEPERVQKAQIKLLMSHLSCASDPRHPINEQQLQRFQHVRKCLPMLPGSFANSAGVFLDKNFHQDLGRPGCAIYGINPYDNLPCPVEHVATLSAPIIQLRTANVANDPVGYSASVHVPKGTRIATVGIGYADGWHRILSNTQIGGYIGGHFAPLLGRVSMDLVMLDVSRIPDNLCQPGQRVQLICPQQDVNAVAKQAQTIGYEIFTRLGRRVHRRYSGVPHPLGIPSLINH